MILLPFLREVPSRAAASPFAPYALAIDRIGPGVEAHRAGLDLGARRVGRHVDVRPGAHGVERRIGRQTDRWCAESFVRCEQRVLRPAGFAALLLGHAVACAQGQASLAPVEVTAARIEQRVDDAFAAVTVLRRDDIEAANAPDLATLLRQQAGVEITQLGGHGTQAGAFVRGGETRHTLVLVDGVPVSNLNFGLAPLEHLMLANVERIEIARGNLSSVYGSSALGGVVQIFTGTTDEGSRARAALRAETRDTQQLQASAATRTGGTSFGADASILHAGGYNAIDQSERPGTNPDRDPYRNRLAGVFLTHDSGPWNAALRYRRSQGTTAYDSQFGPATQPDESKFRIDVAQASAGYRTADVSHLLRVSTTLDDLRADVAAFPFFVKTRTRTLAWETTWQLAAGHRVNAGAEHARSSIDSDTAYAGTERRQRTLRLGYLGEAGPHQWQANARVDDYSDFGDATTGLLAYGYRLSDGWRASVTLANGFNAPTFNDLFYPFLGNPDLDPERSLNRELALQYRGAGTSFRATLFDNRYSDLIGSDANFVRINVDRARVRGVELMGEAALGTVQLSADLTLQDPEDTGTGLRLARRARVLGGFTASTQWQGARWAAHVRHVGRRYDDVDNAQPMGSYATLDVTARKPLGRGWTLGAGIRNATGKKFETAYGYRQPRAVASVVIEHDFR
jgi:vitamin B12 transporter